MMAGCNVRDDGRPGPCGLFLDEHRLVDGEWTHPDDYDDPYLSLPSVQRLRAYLAAGAA